MNQLGKIVKAYDNRFSINTLRANKTVQKRVRHKEGIITMSNGAEICTLPHSNKVSIIRLQDLSEYDVEELCEVRNLITCNIF